MATRKIQRERVQNLNEADVREGDYVLYWMQSSQRAEQNHALEYAVKRANELDQRLLVVFGLTDDYPEANLRHYTFMLEGLKDVQEALEKRGIKMAVREGSPEEVALDAGKDASLVITDRGYMRPQKKWRKKVAGEAGCLVTQVESDVVVPVELASEKRETAARTLRLRIGEHLEGFLVELTPTKVSKQSLNVKAGGLDLSDIEKLLAGMDLDRSVGALSDLYRGGTSEAKKVFRRFLKRSFDAYEGHRNQPHTDDVSHMSKYLHFGHISPIWLALEARRAKTKKSNIESFVEELVVRRELSMNFVHYTPDYDSYSSLPDWAKKTLEVHKDDEREHTYTREQLENAE